MEDRNQGGLINFCFAALYTFETINKFDIFIKDVV